MCYFFRFFIFIFFLLSDSRLSMPFFNIFWLLFHNFRIDNFLCVCRRDWWCKINWTLAIKLIISHYLFPDGNYVWIKHKKSIFDRFKWEQTSFSSFHSFINIPLRCKFIFLIEINAWILLIETFLLHVFFSSDSTLKTSWIIFFLMKNLSKTSCCAFIQCDFKIWIDMNFFLIAMTFLFDLIIFMLLHERKLVHKITGEHEK